MEIEDWDEEVEKVHHDVHEPTTYELAEAELKSEQHYIVKDMMGERFQDHFEVNQQQ